MIPAAIIMFISFVGVIAVAAVIIAAMWKSRQANERGDEEE